MTSLNEKTALFRKLHGPGEILVLPNAWDAGSARLIEEAGAKAIATSSAAVSWAHGYADGETIPPRTLLSAVREIARVIHVPLSVDAEAGLDATPQMVANFVMNLQFQGSATAATFAAVRRQVDSAVAHRSDREAFEAYLTFEQVEADLRVRHGDLARALEAEFATLRMRVATADRATWSPR